MPSIYPPEDAAHVRAWGRPACVTTRAPSARSRARSALLAATAALVAAAISGCGSNGVAAVSGPAVFATHCAICHSISGSSTPHQQGGDLRSLRLPRGELLQFAAEMPVIHSRLTARELRAVISYMQSVERR